jgi:D-lyxose ketol-isomerase
MARGWGPEVNVGNNPKKNQWKITDVGREDEHKVISLNTDMCLFYSKNQSEDCTRKETKKWAKKA